MLIKATTGRKFKMTPKFLTKKLSSASSFSSFLAGLGAAGFFSSAFFSAFLSTFLAAAPPALA